MIHSTRNLLAIIVVSLFVAVISLPGITSAAVAPKISTQTPVKRGMVAPVRIAMDASGNYYVTDPRSRGVLKYNPYGRLVKTITTAGVPLGVAVAASGNVIVTQGTYASILDQNGAEVTKLGSGVGQFVKANGVTIDGNGYVYVTDGGLNLVQVFNGSGSYVTQFGGKGVATVNSPQYGYFNDPTAIAYEKVHNQIAVADTLNGRIQFFDATNYAFVKSIGMSGDAPLTFVSPQGVAFEYANATTLKRMYVVDTWKNAMQVVDTEASVSGNFLSLIGCGTVGANFQYGMCGGVADGQMQLPSDVVFDAANGRLLVVNGAGSIQIYGVDGGSSPFDNIPPVLTLNAVPSNTSQSSISISGTVESGADLKVTISTSAVAGAINNVSGAWNTTITGLNFGNNLITVAATDAAGNTVTKQVPVIYSLPAPALSITTASNILTNTSSQTLNGTVDAGATVTVTNTITGASGAAVVTGTAWSYTDSQLVEGPNNFIVTATQPSSSAATAAVTVVRDTVQPVLTVSALANGSYSSDLTQNIAGTVTDLHPGTVTVTVNGTPTTVAGNSFSVPANLQVGANTITVQAFDQANNASFPNTRIINYDAATPVVNITTPPSPADNSYVATSTVGMSGTVTPVTATIAINGVSVAVDASGNWPAGGGTTPVTLASGINTLEVVATSGAKSSSMKRSVIYDPTAPVLSMTSPAQDIATNQPNMNISGTVSDSSSPVTLSATVNGVPVSPAPAVTNGTYSFNATFGPVEQPYSVVMTATNAAGTATTLPTRTITYDITPPALTLNPVSAGYPKSISGTVERYAGVTVADGAATFPVTVVDGSPNATWSADLSAGNYDPSKIKITATDPATNPTVITGLAYNVISGDIVQNGIVDINDARYALQCVVGLATPTSAEIQRGDIGPLLNGKANPNGKIDLVDAILILRKALGDPVSW